MTEKHIETIARGVCIVDGKVLLCLPKDRSYAYLPGGHIEFGETGREALVREMKEETGLDATAGELMGVVESSFVQKGEQHCEINLIYEMKVAGCGLRVAGCESRVASRESRVASCESRVAGCESRVAGCGLRVAGCGLRVASREDWICFEWAECDKIDSVRLLPDEMKKYCLKSSKVFRLTSKVLAEGRQDLIRNP